MSHKTETNNTWHRFYVFSGLPKLTTLPGLSAKAATMKANDAKLFKDQQDRRHSYPPPQYMALYSKSLTEHLSGPTSSSVQQLSSDGSHNPYKYK